MIAFCDKCGPRLQVHEDRMKGAFIWTAKCELIIIIKEAFSYDNKSMAQR